MIKAIARGRAWIEDLGAGRARSLRELAERDGITRRYVRRLVDLAFLSPELVEVILQGRQPVKLTATRLIELDLPLDWTEQRSLLASCSDPRQSVSRTRPGLFSLSADFPRGGLHQCRSEKSSQGEPARGQHVPFSGLVQAHTPGQSRAFAHVAMEGTGETDSAAEEARFEPLVPRLRWSSVRLAARDAALASILRRLSWPFSALARAGPRA